MNFKYEIKVDDNFPQLHEALESWVERVLTLWGMKIIDYATLLVSVGTADSTGVEGYVGGALKASLTYAVSLAEKTVTVGSALLYALYVELGTGIFAEKGDGRKTPWVWPRKPGLAVSVSTGTARAHLSIPILAAASLHGSAPRPVPTPAPATTPSSCRRFSRAAPARPIGRHDL